MFEKIKKMFSKKLKKTSEKLSAVETAAKTDKLSGETLAQTGVNDSEFADDYSDFKSDDADRQNTPYTDTSDYCMIRPDASFNSDPGDTVSSQSS